MVAPFSLRTFFTNLLTIIILQPNPIDSVSAFQTQTPLGLIVLNLLTDLQYGKCNLLNMNRDVQ